MKNVDFIFLLDSQMAFIAPVKLEVKEFKDKQNPLYVAISLGAIKKTEVSKQGTTENSIAQKSRSATIRVTLGTCQDCHVL